MRFRTVRCSAVAYSLAIPSWSRAWRRGFSPAPPIAQEHRCRVNFPLHVLVEWHSAEAGCTTPLDQRQVTMSPRVEPATKWRLPRTVRDSMIVAPHAG